MDRDMEATNEEEYEADYTEFLEDLEEDKAYRSHVNIYHGEGGGRCVLYGATIISMLPLNANYDVYSLVNRNSSATKLMMCPYKQFLKFTNNNYVECTCINILIMCFSYSLFSPADPHPVGVSEGGESLTSDLPQVGLEEMLGAMTIQEVPIVEVIKDEDVLMTD